MDRLLIILSVCIFSGCTTQLKLITEAATVVHPSDFVADRANEPKEIVTQEISEQPTEETAEVVTNHAETVVREKDPFDDRQMPRVVGVPITVEALIGQVNGSPIYANTVLEPIADQLWAYAKTMSRSEFADEIRSALYSESENMGSLSRHGRVYELVISDLLLSEARGVMTKEQSYGLFAVFNRMREDLAAGQGGSKSGMRSDMEEAMGNTVDEFIAFQRDQILIDTLYRQKIWPLVSVTWRDIQREFEKITHGAPVVIADEDPERIQAIVHAMQSGDALDRIKEARGSVELGLIRLKKDDPRVVQVTEAYESGSSFAELVVLAEASRDGVWDTFEMGVGGLWDIDVRDEIKTQLQDAEEGDILPAFELGSTLLWIAVLHVQQPVSMYNRQLQITLRNMLRWSQFTKEKDRFVESLWGEGSIDEVKAMAERVTNIAVRRYQH